jgi:predicted nucleic acid-binding protein
VNGPRVVVDTNVLFAALVSRRGRLRELLLTEPEFKFHCPRFLFVELFKHKERILEATELDEDELLEFLNSVLGRISFEDESTIPMGTWLEARRLCLQIDPKDVSFVALALHLNASLWTEDEELKRGLQAKGFNRFFVPDRTAKD